MEILFYIGVILFAIGGWQAFMRGTYSEVISGVSLILGTILVFVGNWHAGLFLVFMFGTWFLLMQIYRFSTYHRYFPVAAIFLVAYAALVSFLLRKFGFANFVWWYLILTAGFLLVNHKKQHKAKSFLDILPENEKEHREEIEKSFKNTIKYHLLSSVVYILAIAFAFFYFSGGIKIDQIFSRIPSASVGSDNIEHFGKSIDFANKATKISNSGGTYQQMGEGEIKEMVANYKQALSEAKQVDIQKLNSNYQSLGDHYKNEFIAGIEMFTDGFEKSDTQKFLQGQILLSQWGDWYEKNFDTIRSL